MAVLSCLVLSCLLHTWTDVTSFHCAACHHSFNDSPCLYSYNMRTCLGCRGNPPLLTIHVFLHCSCCSYTRDVAKTRNCSGRLHIMLDSSDTLRMVQGERWREGEEGPHCPWDLASNMLLPRLPKVTWNSEEARSSNTYSKYFSHSIPE